MWTPYSVWRFWHRVSLASSFGLFCPEALEGVIEGALVCATEACERFRLWCNWPFSGIYSWGREAGAEGSHLFRYFPVKFFVVEVGEHFGDERGDSLHFLSAKAPGS